MVKLCLPLVVGGVLLALVGTLASHAMFAGQLRDQMHRRAQALSSAVNYAAEINGESPALTRIVNALAGERDVNLIAVADGAGRVIACSRNGWHGLRANALPDADVRRDLAQTLRTPREQCYLVDARDEFTLSAPLLLSREQVPGERPVYGAISVRLDARPMYRELQAGAWLTSAFLCLVLASGVAVGFVVLRHSVLRRVADLCSAMDRQAGGDDSARAPVEGADEIDRVAKALNRMILALRDSERRLLESEARFRTLCEAQPDVVWTADAAGAIEYVNRHGVEYMGLNVGGAPGRRWQELVHPEDLSRRTSAWAVAVGAGQPHEVEYRLRRASDQAYRWHVERAVPHCDETGSVVKWLGVCSDVDDLKRANDERACLIRELQAERAKLTDVIAQAPAFMCTLRGPEHVFELANPMYYQLVGHRDVVGRPVRDALPDLDGQGIYELLDRVYASGEPYLASAMPIRLVRDAGGPPQQRLVSFVYQPMRNAGGQVVGILVHGVDVTDQRLAEQRLRESERRLRALIDNAPASIFYKDLDGRLLDVNRYWADLVGATPEAVQGKLDADFFPPAAAGRFREADARVVRERRAINFEEIVPGRAGERVFDSVKFPLTDDAGQVYAVCGIATDVTEQRRAEQALAASERFARAVVDALTAHVAILDECGTVVAVNLAWQRFARSNGLPHVDTWVGHNYLDACDDVTGPDAETAGAAAQGIRAVLHGEVPEFYLEYSCHSPEVERWFAMRVTLFDGGTGPRVLVAHENITGRVVAERLERERSGLREAVSGMEHVLGVVGHELRTPLAALRAICEFLLTDGARETREWEQFMRELGSEVDRMSDTVNNLLEAARINSGRARWNWGDFSAADACAEAIETVRPLVDESRVELRLEAAPCGDCQMRGDADAVRRLVTNLLSNARKHTSRGDIRVTVRPDADEAGRRWVEIAVHDTGAGIPPEILSRLGEAFALNAGVVGGKHVSGTGLGLAICRGITAAHGGELRVRSTPGEGTEVVARVRADLSAAAEGGTQYVELSEEVLA